MGTNFYLKTNVCEHCGRGGGSLHIGKSSVGWVFALHVIPEEGIHGLEDWEERWKTGVIEDEYGERLTPEMMRRVITHRWRDRELDWSIRDFSQNHAEPGPNNLVRSVIDGRHCIGHGEGTWDLHPGEFS